MDSSSQTRRKKCDCTKWIYRNKLDENDELTRNKEKSVYKGYAQEEEIDYREMFSHVTRFEGVGTMLA